MWDATTPTVFPLVEKHANSVDRLLAEDCISQTWSLRTTPECHEATLAVNKAQNPHSTDGNELFQQHLKRLVKGQSLVQN